MRLRTTITLLASAALLVSIPASAGNGFGSIVGKSDYDYTPAASAAAAILCFIDKDLHNNVYDRGDAIYLNLKGANCNGKPKFDDIRVVPYFDTDLPGSEVEEEHPDARLPFDGIVTHFFRYIDLDGDGKFKSKDALYLDIVNLAAKTIDIGDLRLTASTFGPMVSNVQAGDADVSFGLLELKAGGVSIATANAFYKAASTYYLNVDVGDLTVAKESMVEDNDFRFGKAKDPFASLSGAAAAPATSAEGNPSQAPTIRVDSLTIADDSVLPGALVRVTIKVTSTADVAGSALLPTTLDNAVVDARGTPTLQPGESVELVIALPAPEVGFHHIKAGGKTVSLHVAAPAETATATASPDVTEQHVPVGPMALLALLVGTIAYARRK